MSNNLENIYNESLVELGKLKKIPKIKEWNKIAAEKCLMSTISLRYYSGKSFIEIFKESR